MVYEASQIFRNPVHGCVGVISDFHKKVAKLQSQSASTQTEMANISVQHANLLALSLQDTMKFRIPNYTARHRKTTETKI